MVFCEDQAPDNPIVKHLHFPHNLVTAVPYHPLGLLNTGRRSNSTATQGSCLLSTEGIILGIRVLVDVLYWHRRPRAVDLDVNRCLTNHAVTVNDVRWVMLLNVLLRLL